MGDVGLSDVAIPADHISMFNLLGSFMSTVGSLFVICTQSFLKLRYKDSVRTQLIMCLLFADFLNALNNSISGTAASIGRELKGPWCTVNGFAGQLTVVASDLSIFTIAVATVMTVKKPLVWRRKRFWMQRHCGAVVAGLWLYSLMTAMVALFTVGYVKSAPNWCWINPSPPYVRYVLNHGVRIAIILSIISMYSWMYSALKMQVKIRPNFSRIFRSRPANDFPVVKAEAPRDDHSRKIASSVVVDGESVATTDSPFESPAVLEPFETTAETDEMADQVLEKPLSVPVAGRLNLVQNSKPGLTSSSEEESSAGVSALKRDPIYRAMRMMIIFPVIYTVLWIPGLANRFYNMATNRNHEILNLLQGLTQWAGFCNAVVYGLNHEVRQALLGVFETRRHLEEVAPEIPL